MADHDSKTNENLNFESILAWFRTKCVWRLKTSSERRVSQAPCGMPASPVPNDE
jgi:hypothetical protein